MQLHWRHSPNIHHGLQCRHNTFFSDLEEVSVASRSLEELHDDGFMWVGGDAGLDHGVEHLAVRGQGILGVIRLFPLLLRDGR